MSLNKMSKWFKTLIVVESWESCKSNLILLSNCSKSDSSQKEILIPLLSLNVWFSFAILGPKVPPLVISKTKNVTPSLIKSRPGAAKQLQQHQQLQQQQQLLSAAAASARSPVIVQLRKKGPVASYPSTPASLSPSVVIPRLTRIPPKGSASRSKKKPEAYYNAKAKPTISDGSRSSRRATR